MKNLPEPTEEQRLASRLTAWAVDELPAADLPEHEAKTTFDFSKQSEAEATRAFCQMLETELRRPDSQPLQLNSEAKLHLETTVRRKRAQLMFLWIPSWAAAAAVAVTGGIYFFNKQKTASTVHSQIATTPHLPTLTELSRAEGEAEDARRALEVADGNQMKPGKKAQSVEYASAKANYDFKVHELNQLQTLNAKDSNFKHITDNKPTAVATQDPLWVTANPATPQAQLPASTALKEAAREREMNKTLSDSNSPPSTNSSLPASPAKPQTPSHFLAGRSLNKTLNEATSLSESLTDPYYRKSDQRHASRYIYGGNSLSSLSDNELNVQNVQDIAGVDAIPQIQTAVPGSTAVGIPESESKWRYVPVKVPETTTASYDSLPENPFLPVIEKPLSTFSIDVDTASYAIVRRHLNAGQLPPAGAVRLEEMINYFPMDDAPPADGKPFAVHLETASAPWAAEHRLVRVALKGRAVPTDRAPASLVFLVDSSGSMNQPNKLPLVQKSLQLLLSRLDKKDRVALVTYAGESRVVLPSTPVSERSIIASAINSLSSSGGTNGSGGITAAYETARANFISGGVNRVILATDGDFNVGLTSREELETLITREAKSGVYLSVLAYGSDNLKDDTAELLADKGNGNYAYIDSLSEAHRALIGQMSGTLVTIAKDVKIQLEFNPAKVSRYRLLGYENRALADKDFNDDTRDAGEIGAGHSVTALYEIIPAGVMSPAVSTTDPLKYQTPPPVPAPAPGTLAPQAASGELLTVKLRYQQPEGTAPSQLIEVAVKDSEAPVTQASANFRWTAAVAGYGMLLRGSSLAGNLDWEMVRKLAAGSKGDDPDGFRGEFLQLIEKAAGLVPQK